MVLIHMRGLLRLQCEERAEEEIPLGSSSSPPSGLRQNRMFGSKSLVTFAQRSGIKQINMPGWHLYPDYMQ